jgi:hypothetical protein
MFVDIPRSSSQKEAWTKRYDTVPNHRFYCFYPSIAHTAYDIHFDDHVSQSGLCLIEPADSQGGLPKGWLSAVQDGVEAHFRRDRDWKGGTCGQVSATGAGFDSW